MGKMSRRKGQEGEREVFGLLSDLLGFVVKRNVNARRGDCDSLEIPGWACEVKRVEKWETIYWRQACDQAVCEDRKPVLFFRANLRPWVAMVDLADLGATVRRGHRVEMSLEAFADLAREKMGEPPLAHDLLREPRVAGTAVTPVITPLIKPMDVPAGIKRALERS